MFSLKVTHRIAAAKEDGHRIRGPALERTRWDSLPPDQNTLVTTLELAMANPCRHDTLNVDGESIRREEELRRGGKNANLPKFSSAYSYAFKKNTRPRAPRASGAPYLKKAKQSTHPSRPSCGQPRQLRNSVSHSRSCTFFIFFTSRQLSFSSLGQENTIPYSR